MTSITQNPCNSNCEWHGCYRHGSEYDDAVIFPADVCPFLYHSLYPYYLGLLYRANMQDIWVCCPAMNGVDCLVRSHNNNDLIEPYTRDGIPFDERIVYAEVVKVGDCPHGHTKGQLLLFPTPYKQKYICPAGLNNLFPFLDLELPKCIDPKNIRCPDWKDVITYDITRAI